MAKIDVREMDYISKEHNNVHAVVYSTYTYFELGGEKIFQIDTYGRPERKMPDKVSQTIQLDKASASLLVNKLIEIFGLKY